MIGHEFVGEVVAVGDNVTGFAPGDLVSGEGHLVCGRCRNCMAGRRHLCAHTEGIGVSRTGAFAEYIALPMTNVWHHHPDIDRDVASIFDPFGNAMHTALAFPVLGEDVLITGAGPIGIMAAAVVRHAGARHVVITDVNEHRLELARRMGVTRALDVRTETIADVQTELGMDEGFDVGLEMSGNAAALRDMIANMAHGGRIALLGIPPEEFAIDWNQVVFNMLTIKRHLRPRDVRDLVRDVGDGPERPRHLAGDHAPLRLRGLRRGLRHRGRRQGGQGHPALEGLMYSVRDQLAAELDEIRDAGLFKAERVIGSPQQANVRVGRRRGAQLLREQLPRAGRPPGADRGRAGGARPLGLRDGVRALHLRHAGDPQGARGEDLGASSAPRTRSSTAPASTPTAGCSRRCSAPEDAVISDALNHASIIDGIRLCKAQRHRYANSDMDELEALLKETAGARRRLIATDGVFSMDGYVAKLDEICDLAERYDAMVMVDDSHAVGFVGESGRGTPELQRRDGPRRHHHRHARQGARRRVRRLHERPRRRSSSCCASARGRTCSRTRWRRRSWPPR